MWQLLLYVGCFALNIFIVPHSHIDAGWLKPLDLYYTDHATSILTNIITLLEEFPEFKFVWSEAVFLQRFLSEFPENIPKMKQFISEGRLEIVGGGWVMNDEALVDFEGVTRQMLAGHRYFKDTLGVENITIAWQLDPFGHSSLTPALFERMGFEYMVMARIHGDFRVIFTKEILKNSKNMEFVWKSYGLGASRGIFTHLLYHHYSLPDFLDSRQIKKCFKKMPLDSVDITRW